VTPDFAERLTTQIAAARSAIASSYVRLWSPFGRSASASQPDQPDPDGHVPDDQTGDRASGRGPGKSRD
jgi:hypothetical protein